MGYQLKVDLKLPEIESAVVLAPFDKAFETLVDNGYGIISLAQNAEVRILQEPNPMRDFVSNLTREAIMHFPKGGNKRLIRDSPALYSPYGATKMTGESGIIGEVEGEFYPTKEQIEFSLEGSFELPRNNFEIPTDRFDSDDLTVYCFGGSESARTYGEFLRELGIFNMPITLLDDNYVNGKDKPFVRQMLFRGLGIKDSLSGLYGHFRGLNHGCELRGIKLLS